VFLDFNVMCKSLSVFYVLHRPALYAATQMSINNDQEFRQNYIGLWCLSKCTTKNNVSNF